MMVFITIPWFAPAYKAGGPVQSVVNLVNNFTEGVEYRIFCGSTDLNDAPLEGIEQGKWIAYNNHTQVWYAEKEEISNTHTYQLESLKPDVLFIIGIFSWHYNIVPLLFGKAPLKILSVRGMLHPGALSQKAIKKRIFLTALKLSGRLKQIVFHATDDAEKQFIRDEFGDNVRTVVAGNFASVLPALPAPYKQPGSLNMVSVALISPMKNHLLVMHALQTCTADLTWNIYGPVKDMEYWQQCLAEMQALPANVKVVYHGELLPANKAAAFTGNHVFILPSKSENFGHAFTEAFTAGRPVITSLYTPWNGLAAAKAGINAATEKDALAAAITSFAGMNNEEYFAFSEGAKQYAAANIHHTALTEVYKKMFALA